MNGIMNLGVPKLFEMLETHSEWDSYYYSVENKFPHLSASIGKKTKNMPKNRYCNVWPWDHSRVALGSAPDYINASHIKSPIVNHQYIASQVSYLKLFFIFYLSVKMLKVLKYFVYFICYKN